MRNQIIEPIDDDPYAVHVYNYEVFKEKSN